MDAMTERSEAGEPRILVEGLARVVCADRAVVWLEPEQNTSCASCHASAVCGVEPGSSRLVARRFELANEQDLHEGERVVIGFPEDALRSASLTVYGWPVVTLLAGGLAGQAAFAGDLGAALGCAAGLIVGILAVRWRERRWHARGLLQPRLLRRASPETLSCHSHGV